MSRMYQIDYHAALANRRRRKNTRAPKQRRLRLEPLEDRRLLATFTVNNLNDAPVAAGGDAPGTLRQAIFDANAASGVDAIVFRDGLTGTILLTEGDLAITDSVSIAGPGAMNLTIDANDPTPGVANGDGNRIFRIDDGTAAQLNVTLSGLTLTGGDVDTSGGAIFSLENLTLVESHITGNSASSTSGFLTSGGGIYVKNADLSVEDSTISNNYVYHDDGAVGGGIAIDGNLTLLNSTITGNRVRTPAGATGGISYGGGIGVGDGTHLIAHSTLTNNSASGMDSFGGNFSLFGVAASTSFGHSIVANGSAEFGRDISSTTNVTLSFSLVENTNGFMFVDAGGNILSQDPGLADELNYYGGPTPVRPLLPGSVAIDAGDLAAQAGVNDVPQFDQRGAPFSRVADGDGNASSIIDIGAYEVQNVGGLILVVDTLIDEFDSDFSAGDLSLREAVGLANGSVGAETITFATELSGDRISLTKGEMRILDDVTIDGRANSGMMILDASASDPTPDENLGDGSRVFNLEADNDFPDTLNVSLIGLHLTGGDVTGRGGAVFSRENLVLDQVAIDSNFATDDGGGLDQTGNDRTLTIDRSTISRNTAGVSGGVIILGFSVNGGGGIRSESTDTLITSSTISGNSVLSENAVGGGVAVGAADLIIRHSTIANNSANAANGEGGNLSFQYSSSNDEFVLDHTVVSGGVAQSANDIHNPFDSTMADNSLIQDTSGLTIVGSGNVLGGDSDLGPLTHNGGATETHAISSTSAALDAGAFTFVGPPNVDQRGVPFDRLVNGDGDAFTIVDIGAYERQAIAGLSLVVDTTQDEVDGIYSAGDLSLREAIGLANGSIGHDLITFAPQLVGKTIPLSLGELRIVDDVTIDASSLGGPVTVDASGNLRSSSSSRVFHINDDDDNNLLSVQLTGLKISGGHETGSVGGGGILNYENLTVTRSTVSGNSSNGFLFGLSGGPYFTIGGRGGGIQNQPGSALELTDSTVHSNSSDYGGGISTFGADIVITSSTISNNFADEDGGGIWVGDANAALSVNHSTIAMNASNQLIFGGAVAPGNGGGIWADGAAAVELTHTVVGDNSGNAGDDIFSAGGIDLFYSLIEDGAGFTAVGGPQIIGQDAQLGPLRNNGGPTWTHALQAGSPAIDAGQLGIGTAPTFDQRDSPFARIVDGNNDTIPRIDIGAYEWQAVATALVVDSTSDLVDGDYSAGNLTLREAMQIANGSIGSDTITFDANLSGDVISLVQGQLEATESVEISGAGLPENVIVDASGSDPTPGDIQRDGTRVMLIDDGDDGASSDVALTRITLTGGDLGGYGGGVFNRENLTITGSTIDGNASGFVPNIQSVEGGVGGGIYHSLGTLTIDSSTISNNQALGFGSGGGVWAGNAPMVLIHSSTISGNYGLGQGGGLFTSSVTEIGLNFSTIANNEAFVRAGGFGVFNGSSQLYHSIVADNAAPEGPDIGAGLVPVVYSLVEDSSGFTPDSTFGILGTDPQLMPLADNGGPTKTHAITFGSVAIDNGELGVSAPAFDQRGPGFDRIVDGNNDTFAVIDMGAFEYDPAPALLLGDYNADGMVNTADYTVWRDSLGATIALPNEDPLVTPGQVTTEDYQVWKDNFGNTLPAAVQVPVAAGNLIDADDNSTTAIDAAFGMFESPRSSTLSAGLTRITSESNSSDAATQLALLLLDRSIRHSEVNDDSDDTAPRSSHDTSLKLTLAAEWDEV